MKLKFRLLPVFAIGLSLFFSSVCFAHFGMVIPSDNMIAADDARKITLDLSFSHPFEGLGMDLVKPKSFMVFTEGTKTELLGQLKAKKIMDHPSWTMEYTFKRPGAYAFVMEPEPYWEPSEDCFIIHYTKTVVSVFGDDSGWDNELGLKTEIIPLSRPLGLYNNNSFQGIVKLNGKAVPFAEVEVEFYNQDQTASAPAEEMITQTIKADQNGVFTYSVPAAGWWGFAALNTSDKKMVHQGEKKDIELGAVIWVKFENWQEK
ncbi:MAG: DUF4198 domain-containing protein [Desulfobacter sp.]|nr:DUF4198 domain-containing protein [Desulfobacter sp.]WDP86554.1 MAG: DUF4198 domain-containing protein [Desulfobacter sp.]